VQSEDFVAVCHFSEQSLPFSHHYYKQMYVNSLSDTAGSEGDFDGTAIHMKHTADKEAREHYDRRLFERCSSFTYFCWSMNCLKLAFFLLFCFESHHLLNGGYRSSAISSLSLGATIEISRDHIRLIMDDQQIRVTSSVFGTRVLIIGTMVCFNWNTINLC
jgi:hypothetical protein